MSQKNITITDQPNGKCMSIAGNSYRIIVSGEETDGNYAVIDMLIPPGGGPGPHAHKDIQEMFYVVEGEVEFKTEAGRHIAKQGSLVNIPFGGQIHCFKNTSDKMAHLLCTVVPAGLDAFFLEVGQPAEPGEFLPPPATTPEKMAELKAIGERYGQEFFPADFLDEKKD